MTPIRAMHYLNQFFAGKGGEEKADVPLELLEGPVGPGKRLQALLGSSISIVVTAYCGDNYFSDHEEDVLKQIVEAVARQKIDIILAGPAFASGRYGFACVEICHAVGTLADRYCITAMYPENPGVDGYRKYKDQKTFLLPTSQAITGMEDALAKMARLAQKLAAGEALGPASEEGYLPRGIRLDTEAIRCGADRAVDMLLDKLAGRPYSTEIAIEVPEEVPVAPRVEKMAETCLAIVSTAGVHPAGNPFGFKIYRNTQFKKYPIGHLNSMKEERWEVVHGGYNAIFMNENPNFGVPLDACRALEKEGAFRKLYPYFYGTTGVEGLATAMQAIGKEIVRDMKAEGVGAALLVST